MNSNIEKDIKEKNEKEELRSNLEATKEELDENANIESCNCDDVENVGDESLEIQKYKQEIEDYKNKFMRISADFQNYKKRVEKEKSEIYKFGSEKIIIDILPILDNLERAIQSAEDNEDNKGLKEGIEMVYKQFKDILQKHGVEEIDCLGKEFDPNCHHAVMQEECEDEESNTVIEIFQKGYKLHSKVIRPSMVKVAK